MVRKEDEQNGPDRRRRGYGKKLQCRGTRDVSVECMHAYYYWLSENNEDEWVMALKRFFWTAAWVAIFGPVLIPLSFMLGWIILFFPSTKPDIDHIYGLHDDVMTSIWYIIVASTAMTVEPFFFMVTQITTLGGSDLRDFAIIYMNNTEAFIYFMVTSLWLLSIYVYCTVWFGVTWWFYGIIMSVKLLAFVLDDDGIKGRGGRREYSPGGRGGRQEWRGRDQMS